MRRLVSRALTLTAAGCGAIFAPQVARADTTCGQTDPTSGECIVWVEVPEPKPTPGPTNDGPQDTGGGSGCFWDGTAQGVTKPAPGPVPCSSKDGYWSNSLSCYVSLISPQPPAGDDAWRGHEPGDGGVYNCFQPQTGLLVTFWAQDPPPNSGAGPTPRQVAQIAIGRMQLKAITIGIAPEPGPDTVGLVGMPVWMWAKSPDSHTVGPITASASASGITISATARLLRVAWDMGDGTTVRCTNLGTPYKAAYGTRNSPDCGHTYEKSSAHHADGVYSVTATSSWVITWSGAGQTGTIRLNGLSRSTQIHIGEAQVLVH